MWRIVCNGIRMYWSCCATDVVPVGRSFGGARIGRFAKILQEGVLPNPLKVSLEGEALSVDEIRQNNVKDT